MKQKKNKRFLISGLLFLWSIILLFRNLETHDKESSDFVEHGIEKPKKTVTVFEIREMLVYSFGLEFRS